MPADNKRISGPESSVPYQLFTKQESLSEVLAKPLTKTGLRLDGRKSEEHRKVFLKTGVVTQAKGSAYIESGKTKVIVSVFDPREIPNKNEYSLKGEIYCQFKYAPFSCPKRRQYQQDSEEKQNSAILKQALEPAVCRHEFPNFQVDIYALVLENDGSALSAAITCAGLALAHAGVPMYDLVSSVSVGAQNGNKYLNPTFDEEQLCDVAVVGGEDQGNVVLSVLHTHEQVSQIYQTGNLSLETLTECIELCTKTSKEVIPLLQKCLVKHVVKCIRQKVED